jgi:Tol biopolymer transport system component
MPASYGPWATTIQPGGLQLSTFWKRRLTMLPHLTARGPGPLAALALALAALAALALPTVRTAPARTGEPGAAAARGKLPGRIVVQGNFLVKLPGKEEEKLTATLAVNPNDGTWKVVTRKAHNGRVSPDGETLAFALGETTWNCDTAGTDNPGQISDKGGSPVWSPDGKHLIVSRGAFIKGKGWKWENWKVEADGRNPVQLPIPPTDHVHDWSADGKWLVTVTDRHPPQGSGYQIYVMTPDGKEQRRLTEGGLNVFPRFAPDGKRIVYSRQGGGTDTLWVVNVDGTGRKKLFDEKDVVPAACWSPDGKALLTVLHNWERDENGRQILRNPENADYRMILMDADGTNRRPLRLANVTQVRWLNDADWR